MKIKQLLIITFINISITANAQYDQQKLDKSKEINTSNYDNIKGSPYLYKEFMYSSFFSKDGTQFKSKFLNYNGFEETFEVSRDDMRYNFNVNDYDSIVIHPTKDDSLVMYESYVRGILANKRSLVNIVYYGPNIKLTRELKVKIDSKITETPGATIKNERFAMFSYYSIFIDGDVSRIRLKKSDFTEKLGYKKEILSYLKKEKLSIGKLEDVKKLLYYYETSIIGQ